MSDTKARKVAYVCLGCRVNRVEIDSIAYELETSGFTTTQPADADCVVINTCAVTGEAEAKTRKTIRQMANLDNHPIVVATGCVANLFEDEVASLADNVYVETNKLEVAHVVSNLLGGSNATSEYEVEGLGAVTPTGRTRPGIKIQDGCNNRCTYCIVWKARGKATSLKPELVLEKVKTEEAFGAREIVLTGINLADYNYTYEDGHTTDLVELLKYLMDNSKASRFRLGSIEPPETTDELLDLIGESNGRIAPFLHLALQSGCDKTLDEMGRRYTSDDYRQIARKAYDKIPNLALGCDMIVGFPGETDDDFKQSYEFAREMGFAKMHVFRYSERPGTPAAERLDQVDPKIKQQRAQEMRKLAGRMRIACAEKLVNTTQQVLVQKPGLAVSGGLFNCKLDTSIEPNTYLEVEIKSNRGDLLEA